MSQNSPGVPGVNEDTDRFGKQLTSGDVNHDGYDDLLVGVPNESIGSLGDAGGIAWIPGGLAGITGAGTKRFSLATPGIPGAPAEITYFGWSMSVGELTGDEYPDVAIGIIQTGAADGGVGSGAVLILKGSAAGRSPPARG